jgi:predicted RNase H-like HicB family nuclease
MNSPLSAWTRFPVGLEEGPDEAFHVHAFTLPGCVGSGRTRDDALDSFQSELTAWLEFLGSQGEVLPDPSREIEIAVDEWIATDADVAGGESDVLFASDLDPLSDSELLRGVRLLGALRGRLLPRIRRARDEELEKLGTNDWNVRVILDELARAQWWTLTRLGSSPLAEVPQNAVARLDTAMALIIQHFAHLSPAARETHVELEGEEWTPRKVLRRLLWLEWNLGGAALHLLSLKDGAA